MLARGFVDRLGGRRNEIRGGGGGGGGGWWLMGGSGVCVLMKGLSGPSNTF